MKEKIRKKQDRQIEQKYTRAGIMEKSEQSGAMYNAPRRTTEQKHTKADIME
jgi:hypothetical protein